MSKIDDLEKLQKLKESGALTEEEFEKEKKKILNADIENNEYKQDTNTTHKPNKKQLLFLIISILIIVLLLIGFIIFIKNKPKVSNKTNNIIQNNEISETKQEANEISNNILENNEVSEITEEIIESPIATIEIKDYGTIKLELYYNEAPNTVKNFIALANNGFYDNLTFHRIVKDFMIQGGDKNADGTGNATLSAINKQIKKESSEDKEYSIKGEFSKNGVTNTIKFEKGIIAMARADYSSLSTSLTDEGYNSASSQFFITTQTSSFLDGEYAAFGKVIEGMEILEKLNNVQVTEGTDKPINPPIIATIRVDTKNSEYDLPETHDVFDIQNYVLNLYDMY